VCGIVGAADLKGQRTFPMATLEAMCAAVAHRGPDGAGIFTAPGIAMAVRRLALVDVPGGVQPLSDAAQRFTAIVNGELYDHHDQRLRLAGMGAEFRTRSDAELWPVGFALQGASFLQAAHGQFAVALWDREERTLTLARDRFGICPLYFAEADGWLLFASEIKGLLASRLVQPTLDPRGIDHVFSCFSASPVRSAFAGVKPLPPGHQLVVQAGQPVRLSRFASIEFPAQGQERPGGSDWERSELASELENALRRAVARRLDADVPIATYLSGGVDSALLVALACRLQPGNVTAFSIGLDGAGHDESREASATAYHLGARHHLVRVTPAQICDLFPLAVQQAESPILDHANTCLAALAREVSAHGFKGFLSGEGADEAFAGYPWVSRLHTWSALRTRTTAGVLAAAIGHPEARLAAHPQFAATAAGQLYALTARVRGFLYSKGLWARLEGWSADQDHGWGDGPMSSWAPLHRSLHADYQLVLAGHLLADKGDRVAMRFGLEPRFPFLDEELVQLAASMHPSLKLRGGVDKWILRKIAARYLPPAVARRRKRMFRAEPVIHAPTRPTWVDELLSPASLARTGLFDETGVRTALTQRSKRAWGPRAHLLQGGLSAVVSTQLLAHLFCGGGLCALPRWTA
jgi:asparagine synthase (glutamine-hydrolysing)